METELLIADERTDRHDEVNIQFSEFFDSFTYYFILPYAYAKVVMWLHSILYALKRKP